MVEQISLVTTTLIFWISLIGVCVLLLHPQIGNYKIPGERLLSFSQAGTVMFTGLYSSSILYWSFFESFLFRNDANFMELFQDKIGNPYFLTGITLYNWALMLYITLFVGIVSCIFVAEYKDEFIKPKYQKLLIVIFALLTLFSTFRIMGSLASYILPIRYLLNYFSGIDSILVVVGLITCLVLWSALGGLKHIKKFANFCSFLVLICGIVLVIKFFNIDNADSFIINVFFEFFQLVVDERFIAAQFSFNNQFVKEWTMLFGALHIVATFPSLYFIYISLQGRTVRQFIYMYTLFVVLPTFIIFCVNSSFIQNLVIMKDVNVSSKNLLDIYPIIFDFINLGNFTPIILFLSMITLIVTSVDSIIFSCAKYLKIPTVDEKNEKSIYYVIFTFFYATLLTVFLLYILYFKGNPALAVRLYELNFFGSIFLLLPLLYMIYKVFSSFKSKK